MEYMHLKWNTKVSTIGTLKIFNVDRNFDRNECKYRENKEVAQMKVFLKFKFMITKRFPNYIFPHRI